MSASPDNAAVLEDVEVAYWMAELRRGNRQASKWLVERFYPELRRLAAGKMQRERSGHTWQATVLVNELYFELSKIRGLRNIDYCDPAAEKAAFLALAAHIMHRLLLSHARSLRKRAQHVELDESRLLAQTEQKFAEIEHALAKLEAINPKLRQVVELRVYEGLTGDQIATRLGCARRSVARYWEFARAWLEENFARSRLP